MQGKLSIRKLNPKIVNSVVFCKQCQQHRSQLVFIGTLQEALTEVISVACV
jgi:hypothetical protein